MKLTFALTIDDALIAPPGIIEAEWVTIIANMEDGPLVYAFPPTDNVPAPGCHIVKNIFALAQQAARVKTSGCADCEELLELIEFIMQSTVQNESKIRLFKHAITAAEKLYDSGKIANEELQFKDPWEVQ